MFKHHKPLFCVLFLWIQEKDHRFFAFQSLFYCLTIDPHYKRFFYIKKQVFLSSWISVNLVINITTSNVSWLAYFFHNAFCHDFRTRQTVKGLDHLGVFSPLVLQIRGSIVIKFWWTHRKFTSDNCISSPLSLWRLWFYSIGCSSRRFFFLGILTKRNCPIKVAVVPLPRLRLLQISCRPRPWSDVAFLWLDDVLDAIPLDVVQILSF